MTAAITDHLWQTTLCAVAAALITLALRQQRARVRFWVWFIASFKFLVPFSALISAGVWLTPISSVRQTETGSIPAAIVQIAEPFSGTLSNRSSSAVDGWLTIVLVSVWASGFGLIGLMRIRRWMAIRSAVRASKPVRLAVQVPVRECPGLLEPAAVGFRHPILLLPEGIAERLTPSHLQAVIAHELCHVKRRDNLFALIHMLVEALFWFHPLVWWIGAKLIAERERACDEEVVELGNSPHVYAEAILNVCKSYLHSPLTCASGVTGSHLKLRIENILRNRIAAEMTVAKKTMLAAVAVAVLAMPVVLGILHTPVIRAEAPEKAAFTKASVRRCSDEAGTRMGSGYSAVPGSLRTGCMPLADAQSLGLIQRAYVRFAGSTWPGITPIKDGPEWLQTELYEVEGQAEGKPGPAVMEGPMMQRFLEERFKLKLHEEAEVVPVYELTVAPGGPALKPFIEGSCSPVPMTVPVPATAAGQKQCMMRVGVRPPAVDAQGVTITQFTQLLSTVTDRPVIDKTGLTSKFDIHLEFAVDGATPRFLPGSDLARFATPPRTASSVFAAVRELGLKLEPARGSRKIIVIDHIERP